MGLFKPSERALAVLARPDQARVTADLAEFFGPDGDAYLRTYDKMRDSPEKPWSVRTWSWPVFFISFAWYFYRKQYVLGAIVLLLPIMLGYLLGSAGSGAYIVFAMTAKTSYVSAALERIAKADELHLAGEERAEYLRRAGGVSEIAGGFAGVVLAGLVVLAFAPYVRN